MRGFLWLVVGRKCGGGVDVRDLDRQIWRAGDDFPVPSWVQRKDGAMGIGGGAVEGMGAESVEGDGVTVHCA